VLRHNDVWRAKRSLSVRYLRVWRRAACVSPTSRFGDSRRYGVSAMVSMTPPHKRRSPKKTMNPVRQCARRGPLGLDVAQASPLFSDHAPREVHLWQ
jgi:hypothetical protein